LPESLLALSETFLIPACRWDCSPVFSGIRLMDKNILMTAQNDLASSPLKFKHDRRFAT
jgi:hypothetical protein